MRKILLGLMVLLPMTASAGSFGPMSDEQFYADLNAKRAIKDAEFDRDMDRMRQESSMRAIRMRQDTAQRNAHFDHLEEMEALRNR